MLADDSIDNKTKPSTKKSKKSRPISEPIGVPSVSLANRDKWVDFQSPLVPPAIEVWTLALSNTDRSPHRIRPDVPMGERGYAYPDPNSLVGLSLEHQAKKLCAWLSLRPGIYSKAFGNAGTRVPTASGAAWRCVLTINSTTILPAERLLSTSEEIQTKASKVRETVRALFGAELAASMQAPAGIVSWHDVAIPCEGDRIVDLDPRIVKEIIWELFEHNFRFELYSLDLAAAPLKHADEDGAILRRDQIQLLFPEHKFIIWNDPFPRYNDGFQGETCRNRVPSLEGLRVLMTAWPDVPSVILSRSFYGSPPRSPAEDEELEYQIILFYCQSFFYFFGRPPVVPHRIPLLADSS